MVNKLVREKANYIEAVLKYLTFHLFASSVWNDNICLMPRGRFILIAPDLPYKDATVPISLSSSVSIISTLKAREAPDLLVLISNSTTSPI